MEEKQQRHIHDNLHELIRNTTCHSLFISFLESREILSAPEISELNSIDNRLKKSLTFYRIITQRSHSYNALCSALKKTGQSGALEILERIKSIRFDVRQPVHLFTGRDEELAKLHEHLNLGENVATLVTHTASVTGLGGIGKTELCRKYIQNYSDQYGENVIWIGAERAEMMENSFKTLAKDYLNISLKDADGEDKDVKTVVDEVYNYFREKKCLFVFDNAVNSNDEQLSTYLPVRVSKRPHLLITSRDRDWELPMSVLELEELKEHEAIEFVKKGLSIQDTNTQDDIIISLVSKLQRFPLALQQAISFIKEQRVKGHFEIEQYLSSFEVESKLLLSHQISPFLSNKYAKTTLTTWKLTTDVITADKECGNGAMCILNMISYLEPDKIPIELLLKHEGWNEDEMHEALQLLVKYSMISCQPAVAMLNVHRMVQEVTQIELRSCKGEEKTLKKCLALFGSGLDIERNSVSHAISVFDVAANYELLVQEFSQIPPGITLKLFHLSRYNEAKRFGTKSAVIIRQHCPPDSTNLASIENIMGSVELKLKNYEESINHFQAALTITEQQDPSHGNRILGTIFLKYHISKVKEEQKAGIIQSSLTTSEEMMQIMKQMLGKNPDDWIDDPMTPLYFTTLANYSTDLGQHKEALCYKQAHLDLKLAQLGPDDVEVIPGLMMEVANMHRQNGELETAVAISSQAYEKVVNLFESDVSQTKIGHDYAGILQFSDINQAFLIAKKVYELREKMLGPHHLDTLDSQLQVGRLIGDAGRLEEAIPILQNCFEAYAEQFGEMHDLTMDAKTWLATAILDKKLYAEALKIYRDVLNVYMEGKGVSHWKTVTVLSQIASGLMAMGDYTNSLRLHKQVESTILETYGSEDSRLEGIRKSIELLEKRMNGREAPAHTPRKRRSCCCMT